MQDSQAVSETESAQELSPRQIAAEKYQRDELGLISGVEYVFNSDGSINWRSMIKPEFLYVNKGYFERFDKEAPKSIDGLTDKQLLIMLGGIKELAALRGFKSVHYQVTHHNEQKYVSASCQINWLPNYESDYHPVSYQDFANASVENTDEFCHKFLETIACNRAFIRCVRNYLGIHIVGFDEIDKSQNGLSMDSSENDENSSLSSPSFVLQRKCEEKGFKTFGDFRDLFLREMWKQGHYKNDDIKTWKEYSDIPAKECRKLLPLLEKPRMMNC